MPITGAVRSRKFNELLADLWGRYGSKKPAHQLEWDAKLLLWEQCDDQEGVLWEYGPSPGLPSLAARPLAERLGLVAEEFLRSSSPGYNFFDEEIPPESPGQDNIPAFPAIQTLTRRQRFRTIAEMGARIQAGSRRRVNAETWLEIDRLGIQDTGTVIGERTERPETSAQDRIIEERGREILASAAALTNRIREEGHIWRGFI